MGNEIDAATLQAAMQIVAAAVGQGMTTKDVVSSTPTTTYGHGKGGLFAYPGSVEARVQRDVSASCGAYQPLAGSLQS